MTNKVQQSFKKWKERSSDKYINAICKPCWELKYCPYGVLVENFEIRDQINDVYRCRVFGHLCPAFVVAEPFTETRELRNISRTIPTITQRRVLRRDNYICQLCNKPIPDDKINFDHIIPWSKGGSSDENNIRILCEECNKKRGNSFEEQYLIAQIHEVFSDPHEISSEMITDILQLFLVAIELNNYFGEVSKNAYIDTIKTEDEETDKFLYSIIINIWDLFNITPFFIPVKKKENLLRYRWGLKDGHIHSIEETCNKYKVSSDYYIDIEELLFRQVGFVFNRNKLLQHHISTSVNNEAVKNMVITRLCTIGLPE